MISHICSKLFAFSCVSSFHFADTHHHSLCLISGPIGLDYEVEVDPAVSSMKMSRVNCQKNQRNSHHTQQSSNSHYAHPSISSFEMLLPRKRVHQEGPVSAVAATTTTKSRRLSPASRSLSAINGADSSSGDVVCVAQDVKIEIERDDDVDVDGRHHSRATISNETNDIHVVHDVEDIVETDVTEHPDSSSPLNRATNGNNVNGINHNASSAIAIPYPQQQQQQQYSPFPTNESISEILEGPFPASEALEAKIAACEVYSNTTLAADSPENDVAMKIIRR